MFKLLNRHSDNPSLATSQLFNEKTFYAAFLKDLQRCRSELIIESPFITSRRVSSLWPTLTKLKARGVQIIVNTGEPVERYDIASARIDAHRGMAELRDAGVDILYTGGHHRKLSIIDREVVWEGSLNILSQYNSCEIMRRITSREIAMQTLRFTGLYSWTNSLLQ